MSKCWAPPRSRISSTVRAPAIPLPMTTSRCLSISGDLHEPDVEKDCRFQALGRRDQDFDLCAWRNVFEYCERHVNGALGSDRKVAHRRTSRGEFEIDHFGRGIAGSEIDGLGTL